MAHNNIPSSSYETVAALLDGMHTPYLPAKPVDLKERIARGSILADPQGRPAVVGWAPNSRGDIVIGLFNESWNSLDVPVERPVFHTFVEAMLHERERCSARVLHSFEAFMSANKFALERIASLDHQIDEAVKKLAERGTMFDVRHKASHCAESASPQDGCAFERDKVATSSSNPVHLPTREFLAQVIGMKPSDVDTLLGKNPTPKAEARLLFDILFGLTGETKKGAPDGCR
jgi:hypothetical protein